MDNPTSGSEETFAGAIVRASTTSRWFAFDGTPEAQPTWIPVNDTTGWVVEEQGFVEASSGTRLRLLERAPVVDRGDRFVDDFASDGTIEGAVIVRPEDQSASA